MTGVLAVTAGTAALPAITPSGDPNTGIFSPGADQVAISTNGTQRLFINDAGRVGLGTNSPAENLVISDNGGSGLEFNPSGVDSGPFLQAFNRTTSSAVPLTTVSSYFAFRTGSSPSETMRLDSSGRLGLGTSSPIATLQTSNSSGTVPQLLLERTGTANGQYSFYLPNDLGTDCGLDIYDDKANVSRIRISSTGRVGIGTTTFTANGGVLELSGGITFPATAVAASNANTLDDYEEGTWTPTVSGSSSAGTGTYSRQIGVYTKIGNLVTLNVWLQWTAHTGTGNLTFTNLPFAATSLTNYRGSGVFGWAENLALTADNVLSGVVIQPSGTSLSAAQYPTGGGAATEVAMDTSANIHFSITYQTA
jgi:hypothetical protein